MLQLAPYIVSNVIGVGLVVAAWKRPRISRGLFVLLFLGASAVNGVIAIRDPNSYLAFAEPAIGAYEGFINGWFSQHITTFILTIAAGQLVVASLLALGGRWLNFGILGGVVFLIAIAPLGWGSAFPATLIYAVALYLLRRPARSLRT